MDEKGYFTSVNENVFTNNVGESYLENILNIINKHQAVVSVDPKYFRPTEVDLLIGDPSKSKAILGWKPEYDLNGLVKDMMQSDVKLMKRDAYLRDGGYRTLNYFE